MKTKYVAIVSLAVMAAGFLATRWLPESWWANMLHTGFEAGLVGGLADWFAVTALFRHPLGIPIPHTSLLLKNRNRIVNALISAMENELLKKESITQKLKQLDLFKLLGSAAVRFARKRSVRLGIISFARSAAERVPLDKLAKLIRQAAAGYAERVELRPLAASFIDKAAREGWDERALDYALAEVRQWALKRETEDMLGKLAMQKLDELRVGGLAGFAVQAFIGFMSEEKLGSMLQGIVLSVIRELSLPGGNSRRKLIAAVREQGRKLADNDKLMEAAQQFVREKAQSEELELFMVNRLAELRQLLYDWLDEQQRNGGRIVVTALRYAVEQAGKHREAMDRWERLLLDFAVRQIEANHYRLGVLVRENLDRLDDKSLVRMLEEKIGSDLQWIRVNGAVCGFLVGIVLSFI